MSFWWCGVLLLQSLPLLLSLPIMVFCVHTELLFGLTLLVVFSNEFCMLDVLLMLEDIHALLSHVAFGGEGGQGFLCFCKQQIWVADL